MTISMDLNASPLPEEDEQPLEEPVGEDIIEGGHIESSVETFRRVNYFVYIFLECTLMIKDHKSADCFWVLLCASI